ncbi:MAG: hypothetical protein H0T42_21700 [Deltaproteobacteria bacterium]|nr:hypothetical protein [Deltaproteobacteria bacterium]
MTIEPAAIERILQRLCIARSGTATPAGPDRWAVEIEDGEDPPTPLTFTQTVTASGLRLSCDAPLERYTVAQARAVAELQTELATALTHEKIHFRSFADVAAFIDGRFEAEVHADDGYLVIGPEGEVPISITGPHVSREPWIEVSAAFDDDANPAWLLEKNGEMTSVRFETANESVGLVAAFPIPVLTAQRLLEMIDDVLVMYAVLLAEYEDSEDEDEDEDDDEDEIWDQGAIVGPWRDKTTCLRALDDCLLGSGFLKVESRAPGCNVARVYRIGPTFWIAVDPPIATCLARRLPEHRVFAVDIEYGETGNRAVRAHLLELGLNEVGELELHETLGSEAVAEDATSVAQSWEVRLAARAAGADEGGEFPSKPVYYREL